VLKRSKIDLKEVASLAFSGQMAGILAIDKNWNPVIRYDSWLDIRCKDYVNHLS
jgi:xylulokinase